MAGDLRDESSTQCCIKKTPGSATIKGQQYEIGMAALLYLRGLNCADNLLLGCNVDGLGHFDDLFLKLSSKSGKMRPCFVQLKHRDKENIWATQVQLLSTQGKFSILKYFQSYCIIEDVFTGSRKHENSHVIHDCEFEDSIFVLYTNCNIEHNSQNLDRKKLTVLENILSTGGRNEEIFSFGPEDNAVWNLRESYSDNEQFRRFLRKLRIYSGQCHVNDLGQLVKDEAERFTQAEGKHLEVISSSFIKIMETWWNNCNTLLTECSSEWIDVLVSDLNTAMIENLQTIDYKFEPNITNYIDEKFKNYTLLNLCVPRIDRNVRCLKIWSELENKYNGRYMLMNVSDVVRRFKQINFVCQKGMCKILVIDMEQSCDLNCILDTFPFDKCKVVLVSGKQLTLKDKKCTHYEERITLGQLTKESQERILQSVVKLQGEEVCLKNLNAEDICRTLDGRALSTLLRGEKIILGTAFVLSNDLYITRTLSHQTVLRNEVLQARHDNDIFAVSCFPRTGKKENISSENVILSYADSDAIRQFTPSAHPDKRQYLELCKKYANVHWVMYEANFLVWKESSGENTTPVQFIDRMSSYCSGESRCFHEEGLMYDWRERLLLIMGEPGMGKSSLLNHAAAAMKRAYPSKWVVGIALSNFTSTLQAMHPENISLSQVIEILLESAKARTSTCPDLSRKLLTHSLERTGNITVLIDAVDEVSPNYMLQVIQIVRLLLQTKVSQIWVTSRTVLQELLQKELSSLPLSLQPFTEEEQKYFFTQYFVQQIGNNNINSEELSEQAIQFLNQIKLNVNSEGRHICDIPLHAKLAVDMIKQQVKDKRGTKNFSDTRLSLYQMYECFLNKKRAIYYEKCKVDATQPSILETIEREDKYFIENHMMCALFVVFSPEDYSLLNIPNLQDMVQVFLKKIETEKTGIIDGVVNGKPQFVHYTFCEYLVAKWLKMCFDKERMDVHSRMQYELSTNILASRLRILTRKIFLFEWKVPKMTKYKILLEDRFNIVRLFFDQMLSDGYDLHEAVLAGDLKQVNKILQSGLPVSQVDRGGRLPLHLAASHGHCDISRRLLKAGSELSASDKVLHWRPLRYADRIHAWDITVLLLQHGAKEKDMPVFKDMVNDRRVWNSFTNYFATYNSESTLHFAAMVGHKNLVKLLIQNKMQVNSVDAFGNTPLHVACKYSRLEIIQVLVCSDADLHATNISGDTPLLLAASHGHKSAVQLLLRLGADILCTNTNGSSALHMAAYNGHLETVKELHFQGADIQSENKSKDTPILMAAWQGHKEIAQYLIKHGADINSANVDGNSPLHLAVMFQHLSTVKLLLASGTNINALNNKRCTALILSAFDDNRDMVIHLLKYGPNVNFGNEEGNRPLHVAAQRGNLETSHLLIAAGADINASNINGNTALHRAAVYGHEEIIKILINHGGTVNCVNDIGNTPMHYSALYGHLENLKVLLSYEANREIENKIGQTPLALAESMDVKGAIKILKYHNSYSYSPKRLMTPFVKEQLGPRAVLTDRECCKRILRNVDIRGIRTQVR